MYDNSTNTFVVQESTHWDYKDEFPFSFSGDYFGGILRLICAYYNTYGGILIFGVHDQRRTPGHNKVKVNVERLNNAIRQDLTSSIEVVHREYFLGEADDIAKKVDILLVPKRPMGQPPVRFAKDIGSYKAGRIWMRVGHEVVEPSSVDLPTLYASREDYGMGAEDGPTQIQSALPPSPATVREFIGRRSALDQLYAWLFSSEEPRSFLWGRGGSGKSTIAYQFARMVSESGGDIPTKQGSPIDYVVYLSAKKISLDPLSRVTIQNQSFDFTTAKELYQAILTLVGWTDTSKIDALEEKELIQQLKSLFSTAQVLLVVDDIDTLTTAGKDPGMDTLYQLVVRATAGGKILYTLRNAPTQSLANSIEIPGLEVENELPDFVKACSKQFKVPEPESEFLYGPAITVTERRPLAIEVLIGLRRSAGSYGEALKLYQGRQGDQARDYLFQREYLALPADNRARLFLAALALLGRQASFSELEAILQFSNEQLNDCISQTLEMFLQVGTNANGDTTFSLGAATEQFLRDVSKSLEWYDKLKANVQYFKSPFLPKNPQMSQLQFEVMQLFNQQNFARAVELLTRPGYPAAITEHPAFNMLKGRALAKLKPPKYEDARQAFAFAASHGSSDVQGFREWYWMEKYSGFSILKPIEVCDLVLKLKGLSFEMRSEFFSKKGLAYKDLAVQTFPTDPEKSLSYLWEAISALMDAFEVELKAGSRERQDRAYENLKDGFRFVFICATKSINVERQDLVQLIFGFFAAEAKAKNHYFDAVEAPALYCIRILQRTAHQDNAGRHRGFIQRLVGTFEKNFGLRFRNEDVRVAVVAAGREAIAKLNAR